MGGKTWGNYPFTHARFLITYENDPGCLTVGTPTLWYGYLLEKWVGHDAPAPLYLKDESEPIILDGQELTHHSAELFARHFFEILWVPPWDECLSACMSWCQEKQQEALLVEGWQPGETCIKITQHDTFEGRQPGSSIQLTKEAAERLGEALLYMARGTPHPSKSTEFSIPEKPTNHLTRQAPQEIAATGAAISTAKVIPLRPVQNR